MKKILMLLLLLYAHFLWAEHGTVTIKRMADVPEMKIRYFIGSSNGAVVMVGGQDSNGIFSEKAWVFTRTKESITQQMQFYRSYGAGVSDGKTLFCIGGLTGQGATSKVSGVTWDGIGISVTPYRPLPQPLMQASAAIMDGKLYVFGGRKDVNDPGGKNLYALDIRAKESEWQQLESFPAQGRYDAQMAVRGGALYVFYGKHGRTYCKDAWSYRPVPLDGSSERGWIRLTDPPGELQPGYPVIPTGQSHLIFPAKTVYVYHTITDRWVPLMKNDQELAASTSFTLDKKPCIAGISAATGTRRLVVNRLVLTPGNKRLSFPDWLVIIVYLVLLVAVGMFFFKRTKTTHDYFLSGRKMAWWAVGISLYATGTSAISFLAIPTKTFVTNQVYGIGSLWGPVFIVVAAYLIVPILRGIDITSTYEYLQKRFSSSVRLLGAAISVAFHLGGRMSVVLLLPALALSAVTGMPVSWSILIMGLAATLYTLLGGITAVIWTDVLQVAVLLGGAAVAMVMMIQGTDGGMGGFWHVNTDYHKLTLFQIGWDWTLPVAWVFILNQMMTQATFPADQVMVQRVLTTPSIKAARKSYILLGLIVVPGTLLFHFMGSSLFSFFHSHPALLDPTMDNIEIFPLYIVEALPTGISGLLIAALFAASMSTIDSSINSVTTVFMTDFYPLLRPDSSDQKRLKRAKGLTAAVGIIGTAMALWLSTYEIRSIFDLWMEFIALIGGGFGGVFLLGIFTQRANAPGVIIGALLSIAITLMVKYYTDIHFMLYSSVAVISCVVLGYVASLFFSSPPMDLSGLTYKHRIRE